MVSKTRIAFYNINPAIPAISDITFSSVFDTTSPDGRAADKTEPGGSLRDFHPSEVLSELSPLRAAVAGQGYHYRRMRSSQYSLPRLLLDRLGPLCTLSSFIYGFLRKFLLPRLRRWSSRFFRIAFPSWAHPLMLFCHRI